MTCMKTGLPSREPARAPARRPGAATPTHAPAAVLQQLQRGAGNRALEGAIQRMLAGAVLQRACDFGTCGKYQARHAPGQHELLSAPDGFLSGKGSGQALGAPVRDFMENRFGHDFGEVRVHTDGHAARSAGEISALAYTAGRDIFFAPGQYRPDSDAGRHLLAHELTHVIQQGSSSISAQAQLSVGPADDSYEREADRVADAVMAGGGSPAAWNVTPLASASLQRKACVKGEFTEDAKALQAGGQPECGPPEWNEKTGWFEMGPIFLGARFLPEPGGSPAYGNFYLYAKGSSSRTAPARNARGTASKPARMRLQPGPVEPELGTQLKEFGVFLPNGGGDTAMAAIAPGIQAEAGGEHLQGGIEIVVLLNDRCDAQREMGNLRKRLAFDFHVPQDWAPRPPPETKSGVEAKAGGDRVAGMFTSVPSGVLQAVWDPQREFLGREFTTMAWFAPHGGERDCRHGEYRQFVQASWVRDLAHEGPQKGQPKDVTKRLCEDKFDYETDEKKIRYGHRSDRDPNANSVYGPGDSEGACRYRSWDRPGMYAQPGEKIRFKHVFVGQLIDTSRLAKEPPNSEPYKGEGVLDESTWTVEGAYTRSGALSRNQRQLEMNRREAAQSGQAGVGSEKKAEVLGGKDNQGDSKAGKA